MQPTPTSPHSSTARLALSVRPRVPGMEKRSSLRLGWRASSREGAWVSLSDEVSMLRVTTGRVRVRRTSWATAWHRKCAA